MTADIDLTEVLKNEQWTPIGDEDNPFSGTFDGNGHRIVGLKVDTELSYAGMFGYVTGGKIRNLGLEEVEIKTSADHVGGLAGVLDDGGEIKNSYLMKGSVSGKANVGGLVGKIQNGSSLERSYAMEIVVAGTEISIGGLAGELSDQQSTITNSYAVGTVSGSNQVGGLVGFMDYGTLSNSYAAGNVKGEENLVGGLVGDNFRNNGKVEKSYWSNNQERGVGGSGVATDIVKLSEYEMKHQENFPHLDFANTWTIMEGVSYPYLKYPAQLTVTLDGKTDSLSYPSEGKDVKIEGETDKPLTLRYKLVDGNNAIAGQGVIRSISGNFSFPHNFGELSPGKYTLWLWGTWGAQSTQWTGFELHDTPAVPTDLRAEEGDRKVTLEWKKVTGAESCKVYMKKSKEKPDEDDWDEADEVITVSSDTTSHTFDGLNYKETYWFTVQALGPDGTESPLADAVSAMPKITVTGVETFPDQIVPNGTPLSGVVLPAEAQIVLADITTETAEVNWDDGTPRYNGNAAGTYIFKGTLVLPDYVINPGRLQAEVRVMVPSPARSDSDSGSSYEAPVLIRAKVVTEHGTEVYDNLFITRTWEIGIARDRVALTPEIMEEALQAVQAIGGKLVRVILPDEQDEVSETDFRIVTETGIEFREGNVDLEICTENVSVRIPAASLDNAENVHFRLTPVRDEAKRKEIEERANVSQAVISVSQGQNAQVLGRPVMIEMKRTCKTIRLRSFCLCAMRTCRRIRMSVTNSWRI